VIYVCVRWRGREPRGTWSLKYLDLDPDLTKYLDPEASFYDCKQRCEIRVYQVEGERATWHRISTQQKAGSGFNKKPGSGFIKK
jgi:hypothetical protein